jgi:hypothetical protein
MHKTGKKCTFFVFKFIEVYDCRHDCSRYYRLMFTVDF